MPCLVVIKDCHFWKCRASSRLGFAFLTTEQLQLSELNWSPNFGIVPRCRLSQVWRTQN